MTEQEKQNKKGEPTPTIGNTEEFCPFCFGKDIKFDAKIDGKGRYECKGCGAEFAVAQQVSPSEYQFWDEVAEKSGYDVDAVKAKADQLATYLPKTTGITYGTGAMWHAFHEWKRESQDEAEPRKTVKLKVEDARRDKYDLEFNVTEMGDVECPWCGAEIAADGNCAQGHIAYTIVDPDATEKVNDALRGEA